MPNDMVEHHEKVPQPSTEPSEPTQHTQELHRSSQVPKRFRYLIT